MKRVCYTIPVVKYTTLFFSLVFTFIVRAQPITSVSIISDSANLMQSVSKLAINDVVQLLGNACSCTVQINQPNADIELLLPHIHPDSAKLPSRFETGKTFPVLHYPETDYAWTETQNGNTRSLALQTQSYEGISCGLYGLLQEKLGFKFYHPRQTIIPDLKQWSITEPINWQAKARFHKRGFHLHTMHPTELTEQLLDETYPNAFNDVKQYLDWLARNGQNYFEFNLQEDVNREAWIEHAKKIVDYAHSRSIKTGVDLSLHMVQQKAFQLYTHSSNKKKQIDRNMAWLNQAAWDMWSLEFSATEFSSGNVRKKTELQLYITDKLTNQYHVKLSGRRHVVKPSAELGKGKKHQPYEYPEAEKALDQNRGMLMHTVMFYNTTEKAPVYRNENFRHILEQLLVEKEKRETWFYPESAYWITFDNSVPMLLLPYLQARLDDILLMDSLQVLGHLTFSSGWEWGYWINDWSIARWSWKHESNGVAEINEPLQYLHDIFPDKNTQAFLNEAADLQQKYIKDDELIRYLCPSSVTDEFPKPYNLEFQPRPRWTYKYIRRKATKEVLDSVKREGTEPLLAFYSQTNALVQNFSAGSKDNIQKELLEELKDGISITALRAKHRATTLDYLSRLRTSKNKQNAKKENLSKLNEAEGLRQEGLEIVKRREATYRYPVKSLARKHPSHTTYRFGYLYPVSNLHFWTREQLQAEKNNWSPFYQNIFDLLLIIGLKN